MGDATSRLLDARTAGPWAHDPPGSGTVASTVYRGRVVAQCDRLEDADAIARSYEEWPAALERIEQLEAKLESSLNTSERIDNDLQWLKGEHSNVSGQLEASREIARLALVVADRKQETLSQQERSTVVYADKVAELERMLTAWQKHRHSPSLLADWTRYQKEKP